MKKWIVILSVAALMACVLAPGISFTEDQDTILLARTIYALARNESYETKLAIGAVAMNRVENPWFSNRLGEVLTQQHQFPTGSRYDLESLSAAHAVLSGVRILSRNALYYQSTDATERWQDLTPLKTIGGYAFYAADGKR